MAVAEIVPAIRNLATEVPSGRVLSWVWPKHKVVLVGESPPRIVGAPLFSGPSGRRLIEASGLGPLGYVAAFGRLNLLERHPGSAGKGSLFPLEEAREAVEEVAPALEGRFVVLLGGRVASAFRFGLPYFEVGRWRGSSCLAVPHPSGVNRWWNEPANVARFRSVMKWLANL